ncbi:MAG: T9SS type A sorting domain-containing protein [Phaeodactylibacter sp.]|nr:T9SS type A sorting domain-containing protein [Phaeodactylibacter sp.]MCB9272961.1 T9SS type A sorting domain-containing protein [Lewinellaceae bacterium]
MKHSLLSLLIFLLGLPAAFAQLSFSFTPDTVEVSDYFNPSDPEYELVGYATVKNESAQTVNVKWTRFLDVPDGWEVQVCDLNLCYNQIVYSNIASDIGANFPLPLAPGAETNMDVHVKPKGIAGTGEVRIDVSTEENPNDVLISGTYIFNALLTSTAKEASRARLAVFPNPTTDYFELRGADGIDQVVLYNIIGRQARSFNVAPGKRYYIGDLPNGMYLASLVNKQKGVLKTFRVSKRSIQP